MPRVLVLGTGTDVGKTYVCSRIPSVLASDPRTKAVRALKPIESGVQPPNSVDGLSRPEPGNSAELGQKAAPRTSDAQILAAASVPLFDCPAHAYAFSEPLSPHLAARQSNCEIDLEVVHSWVRSHTATELADCDARIGDRRAPRQASYLSAKATFGWTLVETAGAVMSPLSRHQTNFDLALALEPAIWVLVAPDRLGVLHDLTVTLHTMRSLGRSPDSILLSQPTIADCSTGTNAGELRELGIANVDVVVGHSREIPNQYAQRLYELAALRDC